MMITDYRSTEWLGHNSQTAAGNMVRHEFEPKTWEDTDADIKVTHYGISGSDLHWVCELDPNHQQA